MQTMYPNFEVILVDNASKDNSLTTAQEKFGGDAHLKIVANRTNWGFSGGNNIGFEHSKGDFVVFLNNDTIVDPQWLTPMVKTMETDTDVGLTQSLLLFVGGEKIVNAGWIFDNYLISKRELCNGKTSSLRLKPVFEISFACGASMMVRRSIIDEMGLFEGKIPFFYDDTLLSLKTWLADKKVVTVSASKVQHVSGATNVWRIRFTTFHLLRANILLLFDVYPDFFGVAKALFVSTFHTGVNSFFCLTKGNVAAVLGNIEAFMWSIRNLRYIWRRKLDHWAKAKVSPKTLQANYMRNLIPTAFHLVPSKLANKYAAFQFQKYERNISA